MKRRNAFFILAAIFTSFTALIGCNSPEYVPYYSVVYEYGGENQEEWIYIDGEHHTYEYVQPGELATKPDIHREGYKQPTWCVDKEHTTQFDFSTPINQKTKLWAKWEEGEEKLTGISFTTVGKAMLSNLYSGDLIPLVKDYIWATSPKGTTLYQNLKFTSSNTDVFEIKENIDFFNTYAVYAKNAGSATLTISAETKDSPTQTYTDTLNITVTNDSSKTKVKSVDFTDPSEETVNISMGEQTSVEKQLAWKLTGENSKKKIINENVAFYSDNEQVATVDQNGKITFLYKGEVNITIIAYNSNNGNLKKDSIKFNVDKTIHATDFTLNKENLDLFYLDSTYTDKNTFTLEATFTPPETSDQKINWSSSNSNKVSVTKLTDNTAKLEVKANAPTNGSSSEVTITATHNETGGSTITHTCKVRLILPVETMTFSTSSVTLKPKETYSQSPTLSTKANKTVTNLSDVKGLTWTSSDPNVATVDENGLVTAIDGGTTTIRATNSYQELADNPPYAEYEVKVEYLLKSYSLDKSELTLFYKNSERSECDKSYQLKVTYYPEEATDKNLTWDIAEPNPGVATVENGKITTLDAPSDGSSKDVTIIAHHETCGDKTCVVHVVLPIESISFETASKTMSIGETYTQVPTIYTKCGITPSGDEAKLTWESSDTRVATVDENGKVTAISGGDATITVTNNYELLKEKPTASFKIHVNHKLDSISLNTNYIFFAENFKVSETVTLTIDPSKGADDFTITWTSQNTDIATVTPAEDKLSATINRGSTTGQTYITVEVKDKYNNSQSMQCAIENYDNTPTEDKLTFSLENDNYVVSSNSATGHVVVPETYNSKNVNKVKNNGFAGANITDIYLPYTIESIGSNSFNSCNKLSMVLFSTKNSNKLTTIGDAAFKPNKYGTLEYIGLEYCNSLVSIGANAFENQISLSSITIPASVTSIGDNAFNNCLSLTEVIIESETIAKLDNPGALFTILSGSNKIVKVKKGLAVGGLLSDTSKYAKTSDTNYDIYTQI